MKRIGLVLTSLLIGCMIFIGCKKDEPAPTSSNGGSTPSSQPLVSYSIDTLHGQYPTAHCFTIDITYYTGENDSVVVTDVTLPWKSETFKINKTPFRAIIKGVVHYDMEDIPDEAFSFSYRPRIFYKGTQQWTSGKNHDYASKEAFIEYITAHPTGLDFSGTHHIE